jgi:hypothetical protein
MHRIKNQFAICLFAIIFLHLPMNKFLSAFLLITIVLAANSQTLNRKGKKKKTPTRVINTTKVLKGFNQNFSMMPNLSIELNSNIAKLQPQVLRYPGGTVTHSWDWRKGVIETRNSKSVHMVEEIKTLSDLTKAQFIIVLDILNKSLEDQIKMLLAIQKTGVPINYIELGNELYAQDKEYKKILPTGKDYADKVNQWLPELRKQFPKAKIAALLLGRQVKPSNSRMFNWNREVVDGTLAKVDAFTYHIYINENSTFAQEREEFITVTKNANTQNKALWITEYGNKQDKNNASYYTELSALADFVETFPNVTLSLNHQIIGGTKSKITDDGITINEEGNMFIKRLAK